MIHWTFKRIWENRTPIPIVCTKKLKSLGINWVEVPMVNIIEKLYKYGTIGSGFYEHRGYWTILFKSDIDDEIKKIALKCGLKINKNKIYLPNVKINEIEKAENIFNNFANKLNEKL